MVFSRKIDKDISPRINRQTYIFSYLLLVLLPLGFGMLAFSADSYFDVPFNSMPVALQVLFISTGVLTAFVWLFGQIVIALYRLHDLDWPVWLAAFVLVNPLATVLAIVLAVASGTDTVNSFGPVPKGFQYRKVFRIKKK